MVGGLAMNKSEATELLERAKELNDRVRREVRRIWFISSKHELWVDGPVRGQWGLNIKGHGEYTTPAYGQSHECAMSSDEMRRYLWIMERFEKWDRNELDNLPEPIGPPDCPPDWVDDPWAKLMSG